MTTPAAQAAARWWAQILRREFIVHDNGENQQSAMLTFMQPPGAHDHDPAGVDRFVAAAAAGAVLGARMQRWRHRKITPCERCRWDTERTELVDLTIEYRQALQQYQRELPTRLQRAYDAGQAAMLERLTGLQAAESWRVPPHQWPTIQETREKAGEN